MTVSQQVHKFMDVDLKLRVASVVATQVVEEMRQIHNSSPIPTTAVGRAMIGALLMASQLKNQQEVGLHFRGNGPLESIFAEANYEGQVRGYTPNPNLGIQPSGDSVRVGPSLGIGLLTVVRSSPYSKQPHRGTVELITGEIGDDIAYYLQQSHQVPSIVSLGVRLDAYGRVVAAGGVLIEVMPGAEEDTLKKLEASVKTVTSISQLIFDGASAEDLANAYLADFKLVRIEHTFPIKYVCKCSMDRIKQVLTCLGVAEIENMIDQDNGADMTCEFCGKKYRLEAADLKAIRDEINRQALH